LTNPTPEARGARVRAVAGWLATLVAIFATLATSPASEFNSVELPELKVELSQSAPIATQRFRVTSSSGSFIIRASFVTTLDCYPNLDIAYLGQLGPSELEFKLQDPADAAASANQIEHRYVVTAECHEAEPCEFDFEARASAPSTLVVPVEGTLRIASRFTYLDDTSDRFLSIDPI
jgi:hypothetical protein